MFRFLQFMLVLAAVVWTTQVIADNAYYYLPIDRLELIEGELPQGERDSLRRNWRDRRRREQVRPYAILDGKGEIYVQGPSTVVSLGPARTREDEPEPNHLAVCAPAGRDVTGRLFLPQPDWSGHAVVRFKIPASAADKDAKKDFFLLKYEHYQHLLNQDIPGGAWFRHQSRQAQKALDRKASKEPSATTPPPRRRNRFGDADTPFELFTGGRAVSENLQLDRVLPLSATEDETVPLDSIEEITVQEIDWKPLIEGLHPQFDPLADKVPFDQHVVFFPTFKAALAMSDEINEMGGLIFEMASPRSTDARTFPRYQEQLCLTVSGLARLLGPRVARSVALTGSDPYFPTGTDMAVLFETPNPTVLKQLVLAQVRIKAQAAEDARPISGEVAGVSYQGFRTPDRRACSYVARMDGVVVVTNSLYQLERLASVARGETKPIAALDEYKFFRSRYALGEEDEIAFLFLSDATIRRWCGPRWRIANSRRIRDAAVMAELQASQLDRLVQGNVQPGPIYTDLPLAEKGELQLTPAGVVSSALGSLDFMTPIGEMPLDRVSKAEAEAYGRWRDGYQRNWSWAFDPIALRLGIAKEKLSADLTVMPLIWRTDYRPFVDISRGVKLPPDAGDPHDALAQFILAVNKDSQTVHQGVAFARFIAPQLKVDPLGWLGDYVSVYLDDDPFWDELAKVDPHDRKKHRHFMEENIGRLPVALQADVSNGMKLTAFLTAFRAFIEQTSPGMTLWETLSYQDQPYVKITPSQRAIGRNKELKNRVVYYTASGNSLLVTLNEPLLKRSIDRQLAREEAKEKGEKDAPHPNPLPKGEGTKHPWLGESLCLQARRKLLEGVAALARSEYQNQMQTRSWGNLPILNEWKRRYPTEDPVKLHARFWQTELFCPGGGKYVWNDQWQTMESTVYGHPGRPQEGPTAPPVLQTFQRGDFGLTFEEQGLRAKVILTR